MIHVGSNRFKSGTALQHTSSSDEWKENKHCSNRGHEEDYFGQDPISVDAEECILSNNCRWKIYIWVQHVSEAQQKQWKQSNHFYFFYMAGQSFNQVVDGISHQVSSHKCFQQIDSKHPSKHINVTSFSTGQWQVLLKNTNCDKCCLNRLPSTQKYREILNFSFEYIYLYI